MKRILFVLLAVILVGGVAFARGAAPEEEAEVRIGLAFDVGGKGDQSFNDSAYRGLEMVAEEFGGYINYPNGLNIGRTIEMKPLEPKAGGQDREILLRTLAEDGYELIYAVGFMFSDLLGNVAADFPDTHFVVIDGWINDPAATPNITAVSFAEHEGSFLVGALAGMVIADEAPDAPIGFLGGMDMPLIHKFHGGYFAGAMYVNPALRDPDKLFGQYIGQDGSAFADPQGGEAISVNFFNRGAHIVYHAAGGSGVGLFKAAAAADKWAIGVDSDQGLIFSSSDSAENRTLGKNIISSMLKRVDISVFLTASSYLSGELEGGYMSFGLMDGGVDFALNEYNDELIAPYVDELNRLKQMIIDGEIVVPDTEEVLYDWAAETF
ncbi:MAG: BMP family ABC transporter substrate-binding protein [Spirochaetaceae bacterium]|nr:BMP family ABC transporter substrate-binding protein [Spirochaetaceae bacterium]